jgi:hypothetical protein
LELLMMRRSWLIEHRRFGAYLGIGEHPRNGKIAALYRADDARKPALLFTSLLAATRELEEIATDISPFSVLPLNH